MVTWLRGPILQLELVVILEDMGWVLKYENGLYIHYRHPDSGKVLIIQQEWEYRLDFLLQRLRKDGVDHTLFLIKLMRLRLHE